ncbi:ABC transporter ATP-binding protein [Paucibacter sp. DJ2R-2]|uniref:ABC transporter ATP-binding protein n=1 Tax=Paucibacter sp. DJ2R-2 TaxID=2893558 RepID=UPI0029622DCB|nr:ATP-binding cassette domain-containing protein [Paucibacter sp. DJ2R-2]
MTGGLSLSHIHKHIGKQPVLHDISLDLDEGEMLILVGPSGCGKSTLLSLIAGLQQADGGEIRLKGRRIDTLAPQARDIAMVFQNYALYPNMSVAQNIGFPLEMQGWPRERREARVREVAQLLQLEPLLQRRPAQLSGGQRQRVAMGRALARQPQLFLFDEPLSNLDAQLRAEMRSEIKLLHQRLGTSAVYVTHDQVEAMTLGQRIAVLKDGRLQQVGTPQEVYQRPANLFVAGFLGAPAINLLPARAMHDGSLQLDLGDAALPISWTPSGPAWPESRLRPLAGRKLTLGWRAEQLRLMPPEFQVSDGQGLLLSAPLLLVEPTGADSILQLELGPTQRLSLRCPGWQTERPGTRLSVYLPAEACLVFEAESGARID